MEMPRSSGEESASTRGFPYEQFRHSMDGNADGEPSLSHLSRPLRVMLLSASAFHSMSMLPYDYSQTVALYSAYLEPSAPAVQAGNSQVAAGMETLSRRSPQRLR